MTYKGFPSRDAFKRVQRERRLGVEPGTRPTMPLGKVPAKTEERPIPAGDGQPLNPGDWVSLICGQSGPRFVGPRIEAVSVPPSALPYPHTPDRKLATIDAARVWETGFGPRKATEKELAGIPALLLDHWRATVAADQAMSGYGEGSL